MTAMRVGLAVLFLVALPAMAEDNNLQGAWLFDKEINTTLSGEVITVPGPPYRGVLIYTPDGYMSVNLLPIGRTWTVASANIEDFRQTIGEGSSTGYAGRYEVDAKAGTVTHIPSVGLDPADEGQRLTRNYSISGNVLKLSGKWQYQGKELVFTAYWRRANTL